MEVDCQFMKLWTANIDTQFYINKKFYLLIPFLSLELMIIIVIMKHFKYFDKCLLILYRKGHLQLYLVQLQSSTARVSCGKKSIHEAGRGWGMGILP